MSAAAPLLVVSTGCPSGIGPEVSVAAALKVKGAAKVLLGDESTLREAASLLGVPQRKLVRWDGRSRDAMRSLRSPLPGGGATARPRTRMT